MSEEGSLLALSYRADATALGRFMRKHLGKTILFTDNDDWTSEDLGRYPSS